MNSSSLSTRQLTKLLRDLGAVSAEKPLRLLLEPRVVFDAAGGALVSDFLAVPDTPSSPEVASASNGEHEATMQALEGSEPIPQTSNIVFIDSSVSNPAALVSAVQSGFEIVFLSGDTDGLQQIAAYLDGRSGVGAIHILSHGDAGELRLGNSSLTIGSIAGEHADELAGIRAALSQAADILIYGCNVAEGPDGQAFIAALSDATGADIAASDDDTGAATRGGDWDLETRHGLIEAGLIDAPEWNGLLAPLTITASNPPATNGLTGLGAVGLWTNAGTIGGTGIDIRATVVSATPGVTVTFATAFGSYGPGLPADDLWVQVTGGSITVRWEIFATGSGQSIAAVGDPNFRISDIDGDSTAVLAFPATEVESVSPSLNGLTNYTLSSPTNLNPGINGAALLVRGTQNQNSESTSLVGFDWKNVSSWEVTYTAIAGWGARNFFHDGDGDFTFVAPVTTSLLSIDLDGNNSTATGTAYQNTFTENGAAVAIVDADATISQISVLGATIDSAEITLTNAQSSDQLLVNGSPAASGTVNGLAYTITTTGGTIRIDLTGSATPDDYELALQAISFLSTSEAPSSVNRIIAISVTNDTFGTTSNSALATIHVTPVNDAPVAVDDTFIVSEDGTSAPLNLIGNDTDPDGDTLTVKSIAGTALTPGTAQSIAVANGTVNVSAVGVITFTPEANYNGPISFDYVVTDGTADDTGTVSGTVDPVNDAPVGTPAHQISSDGQVVSIDVGAAFTDVDSADIDYTIAGLPAGLSYDPETGVITGTLASNASQGGSGGVHTITIDATDGTATTTRSFTFTVSNPAPVAVADINTTTENASQISGDVTPGTAGQDHDGALDSDPLAVTAALNARPHCLPAQS